MDSNKDYINYNKVFINEKSSTPIKMKVLVTRKVNKGIRYCNTSRLELVKEIEQWSKDNTNKNIESDKGYLDLQQYKFKTYLSSVSRYI